MPPEKHAVLSASSSHRWLNCSPSARLELEFDDSETSAAAEGTAAHALCEHKLRRALKLRSDKPIAMWDLMNCAIHCCYRQKIRLGCTASSRGRLPCGSGGIPIRWNGGSAMPA